MPASFKPGQTVRRNPAIWKNDARRFTVIRIDGGKIYIQEPGTCECFFTGKRVPNPVYPYEPRELRAA